MVISVPPNILLQITRLVDPLPIDPGQLGRQAETIAALIAQRDYVLQQAAEDRERWKYERETWDRTAEALLSQKSRSPKIEVRSTLHATFICYNYL